MRVDKCLTATFAFILRPPHREDGGTDAESNDLKAGETKNDEEPPLKIDDWESRRELPTTNLRFVGYCWCYSPHVCTSRSMMFTIV
jgi:hypothetical protein